MRHVILCNHFKLEPYRVVLTLNEAATYLHVINLSI